MTFAEDTAQGFSGDQVDQTPNGHYTVAGVLAGDSVPETAANPPAARLEATNPLVLDL
jgi:hypothetical protein